ncbi:Homocysteine S-methyltransferase [Aspergillus pseudodeflectus]|uniref:Homocysteine S-methyltransferase n=1 Tax=Aspergillus pseudodeflectus TaxID=176178 RepID=A0ABR4JZP0_9EURO
MQILLLDGGLGTTLESPPYNITFTPQTPLWSSHLLLSAPSTLAAVHRSFRAAGADILLTATYQSSTEGFTRTRPELTDEDAARYMRSAVKIARGVVGDPLSASASVEQEEKEKGETQGHDTRGLEQGRQCRVALSLGPFGATMTPVSAEYSGVYPSEMASEGALRSWHARRLGVFVEDGEAWDGVEYVAFETVKRTDEVRAVRGAIFDVTQGLEQGYGRKPWWVCGVFPTEEVDEGEVRRWVAAALREQRDESGFALPRPWGIGVNCTRVDHISRIVEIMRDELHRLSERGDFVDEWASRSGRPWLVLYPDGTKGEKYDPVSKTWVAGATAVRRPWDESFWDVVQRQAEGNWEGIIIGGCCRAGPDDIAALRRRIDTN